MQIGIGGKKKEEAMSEKNNIKSLPGTKDSMSYELPTEEGEAFFVAKRKGKRKRREGKYFICLFIQRPHFRRSAKSDWKEGKEIVVISLDFPLLAMHAFSSLLFCSLQKTLNWALMAVKFGPEEERLE